MVFAYQWKALPTARAYLSHRRAQRIDEGGL
jgi:hypothetical protein